MRNAVFIDRDDTLIRNDGDLGDPAGVVLMPGAVEAVALLARRYLLIVVTNQGGVARGRYDEDTVHAVHQRIDDLLQENGAPRIHAYYFCPFHPQGTVPYYTREHPWHKPAPGMMLAAARDHDISLTSSWLVGDQVRDVQAGKAAGCRTILLLNDGEKPETADFCCPDILAAANLICEIDDS